MHEARIKQLFVYLFVLKVVALFCLLIYCMFRYWYRKIFWGAPINAPAVLIMKSLWKLSKMLKLAGNVI